MAHLGTLYTIGYGKLKGSADLAKLIEGEKIDLLIDVRFNPMGRNPLWRRELVAKTVTQAGVGGYIHVHGLGNPDFRNGKPATRVADWDAVVTVESPLTQGLNVALMCVCQDTPHCHRRLIVQRIRGDLPGLEVIELEYDAEAGRKVIRS